MHYGYIVVENEFPKRATYDNLFEVSVFAIFEKKKENTLARV